MSAKLRKFTAEVERLYARYQHDPSTRPRTLDLSEAELLAAMVFVMRDEQGHDFVDFERDRHGQIVGVRGARLRSQS